jgi:GNAT superfamily N-acetyltransferase
MSSQRERGAALSAPPHAARRRARESSRAGGGGGGGGEGGEGGPHKRLRLEQVLLDVGQKGLAPQQCRVCDMVWTPSDREVHERFCDAVRNGVKWAAGTSDAEVWAAAGRAVFEVGSRRRRVVVEAFDRASAELGDAGALPNGTLFFHVDGGRVVGVLEAQLVPGPAVFRIDCASPPLLTSEAPAAEVAPPSKAEVPEPRGTFLGVSKVWVLAAARRRGVASDLLRAVQRRFAGICGERIAFSEPTAQGRRLAAAYLKTTRIPVYRSDQLTPL